MTFLGNQPSSKFAQRPSKQDFTGTSGTSLTLNHAVNQAEDILLVINNVIQEAGEAYTASGTTVSLTGTVSASDDIYVIYQSLALIADAPPDGSITNAKIDSMAASKLTGALPAVSGASLTNLPASQLTGALPAISGASLTNLPAAQLTGALPAISGASLTNLPSGGVAGISTSSSSGTALNIDSSNRVTLSNTAQPSWYLKKNNGNVGATNTIVFNDIARAAGISLSNGVVTLPVTGVYAVSFGFLKSGGDTDVEIRLNNSSNSLIKCRASSSSNHSTASGVIFQRFGAGDNIRCVVTNGTIHGSNPWVWFSGYLIG